MINQSAGNEGHGFEPTMGVGRETGHMLSVVHPPRKRWIKILPDLATREGRGRPHLCVPFGIEILVMHTKQKGILCLPGESQRLN